MRGAQVVQRNRRTINADGIATDGTDGFKRHLVPVKRLVCRIGHQITRLGFVEGKGRIHRR